MTQISCRNEWGIGSENEGRQKHARVDDISFDEAMNRRDMALIESKGAEQSVDLEKSEEERLPQTQVPLKVNPMRKSLGVRVTPPMA